ncbi:MAG: helix-turn-helix transcriptional regulator [Alphaproteobacteria bacterium]
MELVSVISPKQVKAARALLDWSQDDLANNTNLSVATIRKLEVGDTLPRSLTANIVRRAMEGAGLEFLEADGVRRRTDDIVVYNGPQRITDFHNDIRRTIIDKPGEILIVKNADNNLRHLDCEDSQFFREIANTQDFVDIKLFLTETSSLFFDMPNCQYRFLAQDVANLIRLYVYNDKYAIVVPEAAPAPKIVVVHSYPIAQAARRQFYEMWKAS